MTKEQALELLLNSFRTYYDIKEVPTPPFVAEAEFNSKDIQYFLTKIAKVSEMDSNEYVFFADADVLDADTFASLEQTAWETGLSRVVPYDGHRSSDVTLIILADSIPAEAEMLIRKCKHYKSYRFTLRGWSHFRLVAIEPATGHMIHNRQGQELQKLFSNIITI